MCLNNEQFIASPTKLRRNVQNYKVLSAFLEDFSMQAFKIELALNHEVQTNVILKEVAKSHKRTFEANYFGWNNTC